MRHFEPGVETRGKIAGQFFGHFVARRRNGSPPITQQMRDAMSAIRIFPLGENPKEPSDSGRFQRPGQRATAANSAATSAW
jgi:hypothetical protein